MKNFIIVQARTSSTRLPGKILKKVMGKPLLEYQIERLKLITEAYEIIIATTTNKCDDPVAQLAEKSGAGCYRGSENNVLERYWEAALKAGASENDAITRVTSDCPLIDPEVSGLIMETFKKESPAIDYVSNCIKRTYPRGLDTETFSVKSLEKAFKNATLDSEKEHVTTYFYNHKDEFKFKSAETSPDMSGYRWTVDTAEDFELIKKILEALYPQSPRFSWRDVLGLMKANPDWSRINSHIKQKTT